MMIRRVLLPLLLVASLAGCANLTNAWNVLTSSQVSPKLVIVAGNTFDALEATATNYLGLPKCGAASTVVCRDPKATAQIIPAIRSGRIARTNLEQFLAGHPGQLGPQGFYDTLTAANATLQAIFAQYGIGGSK